MLDLAEVERRATAGMEAFTRHGNSRGLDILITAANAAVIVQLGNDLAERTVAIDDEGCVWRVSEERSRIPVFRRPRRATFRFVGMWGAVL